jgi:hypothetical protein
MTAAHVMIDAQVHDHAIWQEWTFVIPGRRTMGTLPRLISPARRRVVDTTGRTDTYLLNLRRLGWIPYGGPAETTTGHDKDHTCLNGWIIPGTDPTLTVRTVGIGTRD